MVAGSIDSLANVYGGALPFTGGVNYASPSASVVVTLAYLLGNPEESFIAVQKNIANNYQAILVGSFFTALSYKITKKILRKPINKINTKIFGKRGLIGPIGFKL